MMRKRIAECGGDGVTTADDGSDVYVLSASSVPLPAGRRGRTPAALGDAFAGVQRIGVPQTCDPVTSSVAAALGTSRRALAARIVDALTLLDVGRLANGHLMRRFVDRSVQPDDPDCSRRFDEFVRTRPKQMRGLSSHRPTERVRTFALWNAYTSVAEYLTSGAAVSHDLVLPILTAGLGVGVAVLEVGDAGVRLHCAYGESSRRRVSVVLLKQGPVYEPLAEVPDQLLKAIDAVARRGCGTAARLSNRVREHLQDALGLVVSRQVLDVGFSVRGYVASGLYVPLPSPGVFDPDLDAVFEDALPGSATKRWSAAGVVALLRGIPDPWYGDAEAIDTGDGVHVAIGGRAMVPVRNSAAVLLTARRDAAVFEADVLGGQRARYLGERRALAAAHEAMRARLASRHPREFRALTHPDTPFPAEVRAAAIMELTGGDLYPAALAIATGAGAAADSDRTGELFGSERTIADGTFMRDFESLGSGATHVLERARAALREGVVSGGGRKSVPPPPGWEALDFSELSSEGLRVAARLSPERYVDAVAQYVTRAWDRSSRSPPDLGAADSPLEAARLSDLPQTLEAASFVLAGTSGLARAFVERDGTLLRSATIPRGARSAVVVAERFDGDGLCMAACEVAALRRITSSEAGRPSVRT